jgi:phosphate transport system protein
MTPNDQATDPTGPATAGPATAGTAQGLDRPLTEVEAQVTEMALATRRMLVDAGRAVQTMDADRARTVVDADDAVDAAYLGVERAVIDVVALKQPVAGDLRRLVALLQTGLHLERMADAAVEVSRQVLQSGVTDPPDELVLSLVAMGAEVRQMLDVGVQALVEGRRDLCLAVVRHEGKLDELHEELVAEQARAAGEASPLASILWVDRVARVLQRAGQHAVDIAEAAWFQITGELREFDRDDSDAVETRRSGP